MSENYKPIPCAQHSEYELVIMHKQTLTITWQDEQGETIEQQLSPYDVITEQKAEYLLAKNTLGEDKKIRLDRIVEAHHSY